MRTALRLFAIGLISIFLLAACGGGGGTASYTIGGTVSGLSGAGLVLQNNGGDDLAVTTNGKFTFSASVADGAGYAVTVLNQPTGPSQTCTVNNGAGTVSGANITNVTVTCATNSYTVGGTVSGLTGTGLVLQNNSTDDLGITANENITFATQIADGSGYNVTVLAQPTGPSQTCTVNSGSGTVSGANVTNVAVICSTNTYTIGGTVSGLTGTGLVLQNNSTDDLGIIADGAFTFTTPVADTAGYSVTVLTQPTGNVCTVSGASGTVSGADVTNVTVECVKTWALYGVNGANWNDYVKDDGTDTACDAVTDTACLHGGEMRVVELTGVYSCTGITASDALGAFNWTCDDSTGTARVISKGLTSGYGLANLVDFATPGWKENSLTVYNNGFEIETTTPAVWWSNPVAVDNDGGSLNTAGTIYVVTNDALAAGYIINAPSVALVGQPGLVINGPGGGASSYVISADGSQGEARDFLWVEGSVDAAGDNRGISLSSVRFSALRNVSVTSAYTGNVPVGISLWESSKNRLSGITANNNRSGVNISNSYYNTLSGVTASNNGSGGIGLWTSSYNTLSGVTANSNGIQGVVLGGTHNTISGIRANNNTDRGVSLRGRDSTLSGVTASNNGIYGVYFESYSRHYMLSGVTASNNGRHGVWLNLYSKYNTISGVTASNNGSVGIGLGTSSYNTLSGVTASNNRDYGIGLGPSSDNNTFSGIAVTSCGTGVIISNSSENRFTGPLKVGNNGTDCEVIGGTNPGLVDSTCANQGSSDATRTTGISLANSFVGKVITNDTLNTSDLNGAALFGDITEWSNFENPYRGWGKDGSSFPSTDNQGRCTSGTCRIWDWSLALGDTGDTGNPAILGVLLLPSSNDTLTHIWSGTPPTNDDAGCDAMVSGSRWNAIKSVCETTLLRNAVEIQGDGMGNDNLLCESREICLYTPNIGSYQGHGSLVIAAYLENLTLMKYETNGY